MLMEGFYTALGTPLDESGNVVVRSLENQIEDQISLGASGLLLFGSMGMGGCVKPGEYEKTLKAAASAVRGRCALLVGASENSLARIAEKLAICDAEDIDGAVVTAPYYFKTGDASLLNFLEKAASMTKKDFYLYDLEFLTKHKMTYSMVQALSRLPNVKGIKSGDLLLVKRLMDEPVKEGFAPLISTIEFFDIAYIYGVKRYLDGIFACMPKSVSKFQKSLGAGDFCRAKETLKEMVEARAEMIGIGIWPAFSHAMNLLGYPGSFAPDYELGISEEAKEAVRILMARLGEI